MNYLLIEKKKNYFVEIFYLFIYFKLKATKIK